MGPCRLTFLCVLGLVLVASCLAKIDTCGPNERSNAKGDCQTICNACRDCGPCQCKSGYIRKALGAECVTEAECHALHLDWLQDAKYKDKKDKFFNCPQ